MGQKTHPIGFRLGIVKTWTSKWYEEKNFAKWLHEDIKLKKEIKKKLQHAGIAGVDGAVIEAGRGMGLTQRQIFRQVELPLALPVLLAGLRIVTVQAIGLAVVAALIGAGGLGTFVFEGLGQYAVDLVLLGALPAIFLALAADFILQTLIAVLRRYHAP